MKSTLNRRGFLRRVGQGAVLGTVGLSFPNLARSQSPNSKLNIASIGTSGRAAANLQGVSSEHIVALADVDKTMLKAALGKFQGARGYEDFRVLLDTEGDRIDAVVVSTPDHTHAPAVAQALKMGKPVYCEKPMAHTVQEARVLTELARRHKCVTQMGTQIHAGDNYRRVVELVRSQVIGPIREVHVWVNVGHSYSNGRFTTDKPRPASLNWDLWLGPAPDRPYTDGAHPFNWRQFWEYGNGRLGDFGCHYMDLVHWALDLKQPMRVRAEGPEIDRISPPPWMRVHYDYPARGDQPAVKMTWHGSGKPKVLSSLKDAEGNPLDWGSGQLFIGTDGMILSDYSRHRLLPEKTFHAHPRPAQSIAKSIGHHQEWIRAIKEGGTTTCHFDYAGPLTETVLLGNVSYLSGESLEYDSAAMKITNSDKAQAWLSKEYRKGWTL
jgi:predicted dehydrogenase